MKLKKKYKIELAPTLNQHFYGVTELGKKEKFLGYFPSSTTILESYPLSKFLIDWKMNQGKDESERKLREAGMRGTNVHSGVEMLLGGAELSQDGYSLDEWWRLNCFKKFFDDYKPETIATELRVFSKKYGYAGTLDYICKIDGRITVLDHKTSSNIYPTHYLQDASYAQALEEMTDIKVEQIAVTQYGAKNKDGYRLVIEEDWKKLFKDFLAVKQVWEYDNKIDKDFEPPILNLPETLKLNEA